jgi:hypothetical protein
MASYYLVLLTSIYDVASTESWYYSNYIPTHEKELLKKSIDTL